MKDIIFDGFLEASSKGIEGGDPAILVDETFGLQVQNRAKDMGIKLAAPVEKSGQKVFDFEYGDGFGEKIKEEQRMVQEKIALEIEKQRRLYRHVWNGR